MDQRNEDARRADEIGARNAHNTRRWRESYDYLQRVIRITCAQLGVDPKLVRIDVPDHRTDELKRAGAKLVIRRNWVKAGVRPGNVLK